MVSLPPTRYALQIIYDDLPGPTWTLSYEKNGDFPRWESSYLHHLHPSRWPATGLSVAAGVAPGKDQGDLGPRLHDRVRGGLKNPGDLRRKLYAIGV